MLNFFAPIINSRNKKFFTVLQCLNTTFDSGYFFVIFAEFRAKFALIYKDPFLLFNFCSCSKPFYILNQFMLFWKRFYVTKITTKLLSSRLKLKLNVVDASTCNQRVHIYFLITNFKFAYRRLYLRRTNDHYRTMTNCLLLCCFSLLLQTETQDKNF